MAATPSPSHRNWRAQADAGGAKSAKKVARVALTVVALVMTIVLGWVLLALLFAPKVHFACLPVVDYDVGAVPPIPFQEEDTEQFRRSYAGGVEQVPRLQDLQTSDGIAFLGNRLNGIATGRRDTLILYMSAHGVSRDGTPYVLCSDFLRKNVAGQCEFGRVLEQISQCPARLKLLILDAGQIDRDPRLGMVVNEFPWLVERQVRELTDPSVWVLAAGQPFERPRVSYSGKRSAFGWFAAEALKGHADADADGWVEMGELLDFVRRGVADWVFQESGGHEHERAQLLHAGQGIAADAPKDLRVLRISNLVLAAETEAAKTEAPKTEAEQPQEDAEKPADNPEAKAAADPNQQADAADRKKVRQLLRDAWKVRDQERQRTGAPRWSPVDYAPHLWRRYQEMLLGYEQRYRSGATFKPAEIAENITSQILPWRELRQGGELPSGVGRRTVLGCLAAARRQFFQVNEKPGAQGDLFTTTSNDELATIELIRLKNDLVFHAPYYVRWHATASRSSAREHRCYKPIAELLGELRDFIGLLDALEVASLAGGPRSAMEELLDKLHTKKTSLERLRKSIEEEGMQKDAAEVVDKPSALDNAARIEALLCTPWLAQPQRLELLDALGELKQPLFDAEGPSAEPPSDPQRPWKRAFEQTNLETLLVRLADPAAEVTPPQDAFNPDDVQASWTAYGKLGSQLGDFYQGLVPRINILSRTEDPAKLRTAERLLRLVDARDAEDVHEGVARFMVRRIVWPQSPTESRLALGGPDQQSFGPGQSALELSVSAAGLASRDAEVVLRYDPDLLTVTNPQGDRVAIGRITPLTLAETSTPLRFRVAAKTEDVSEAVLVVNVTCDGRTASKTVRYQRQSPDQVDLVVSRMADGGDSPVQGVDEFRLRPFPNRTTPYRFQLVNRSREARKVSVQLVGVPESPQGERLDQAGFSRALLDASGNLQPGVSLITPPLDVDLPAGDTPVHVPFAPPKEKGAEKPDAPKPAEKEKKEKEGEKADAPKPAEADKSPPGLPIGSQLALVIRDAATRQPKWVKRISIVPRPPRDYVDGRVSYSARQQRILAEFQVHDLPSAPSGILQSPIAVRWRTEGLLDPNATVKDQAALAPGAPAKLFAEVAPGTDRAVDVKFEVDGYPRAFIYHVKCDRDREDVRRERSLNAIRIVAPENEHPYKIPLESPIEAQVEVDAPEDAFREPGDVVEVGIDADGNRELQADEIQRRFYSDRQVALRLEPPGPDGILKIDARVGDFRFPLADSGLRNIKVAVMAQLLLAQRDPALGRTAAASSVDIVFDGASPQFEVRADRWEAVQGEPIQITVQVSADELSGVKQMVFGLDLDKSGKLEDAEQPKKVLQAGVDSFWHHTVETKELQPGIYQLRVIAVDRAGNEPTEKMNYLTVKAPPPKPVMPEEEKDKPKTSTIEGIVVLNNGDPLRGIKVTLKGPNDEVTTGPGGTFKFEKVPPGAYTLEAAGIAKNKEVKGTQPITLPGKEEPFKVRMELKW